MTIATQPPIGSFDVDVRANVGSEATSDTTGVLTINLSAIRRNYRALSSVVGDAECGAVVKADAYGLGVRAVVPALLAEGCSSFFVATVDEAVEVRSLADRATIYLLNGLPEGTSAQMARLNVRPVLASLDEIAEWATYCGQASKRLPAAIQIDTGMNRLGLTASDVGKLVERVDLYDRFDCCLLMSHLACGESPSHPKNKQQLRQFQELASRLPPVPSSIANSSGILIGKSYHLDLVRPGIALYGGRALTKGINPLMPVVKLEARVLQVREANEGETVSYGAERTLTRDTKIATVAAGYADGFLREIGKSDSQPPGMVFFGEHAAPLLGRVSMDLICVDVTDVPEGLVRRGAMAELIGPNITVDEVAIRGRTISYEILTSLGRRYKRHYIGG